MKAQMIDQWPVYQSGDQDWLYTTFSDWQVVLLPWEVDCEEVEVVVEYDYYPGFKGSMNPDSPMFGPAEPESVEILSIKLASGRELPEMDEQSLEALEIRCLEDIEEQREAAEEARAEAIWEDRHG